MKALIPPTQRVKGDIQFVGGFRRRAIKFLTGVGTNMQMWLSAAFSSLFSLTLLAVPQDANPSGEEANCMLSLIGGKWVDYVHVEEKGESRDGDNLLSSKGSKSEFPMSCVL